MRTLTIDDLAALEPHAAAWDELAREAPPGSQSLTPAWFDAFVRHGLGQKERWFCCFAHEGDRLVGVLPVIASPHWLLGSRWPVLHTLHDDQMTTVTTGDVLLDPKDARSALAALLAEADRKAPRHLGFDFGIVRLGSPLWKALQGKTDRYFRRWGKRRTYHFLILRGEFDAYLKTFSPNQRTYYRGSRRKLESQGPVSVQRETGEAFLPEFLALEASGWKGRGGTAITADSRHVAFYETLVRNFAARGDMEWYVLRVGERVVAAQMVFRCGASLNPKKIAFDEEFADARPGQFLAVEMIKDAFSREEIAEINPMSNAPQSNFLRMASHDYVDVHLVRRSIVPALFQLPSVLARSVYESHVYPRVPESMKQFHRKLWRPRLKPQRAADVRNGAPKGDSNPQG